MHLPRDLPLGQLLRELAPIQHPNIVSLEDIFLSPQEHSLYMVFEYADYNLHVPLPISLCCICCVLPTEPARRGTGHPALSRAMPNHLGPVHDQEHHVAAAQRRQLSPRPMDHAQVARLKHSRRMRGDHITYPLEKASPVPLFFCRDIKPANILIMGEGNQLGNLKIGTRLAQYFGSGAGPVLFCASTMALPWSSP